MPQAEACATSLARASCFAFIVELSPTNRSVILQTMSDVPIRELPAASPEAQHRALLEVAEAISQHRDLGELFHELAERLHRVVDFEYLNLILHDPAHNVMRLHILESQMPRNTRLGTEFQVGQTPSGWVWETQQPFILDDLEKETPFAALLQNMRENGVKSVCSLPLTTAQRRLGVMSFGRSTTHQHTESEIAFLQQVARQVAVAVDNVLNFESAQAYQRQLARERDRLRVLLEVNNAVVSQARPSRPFDRDRRVPSPRDSSRIHESRAYSIPRRIKCA